MKSAKSGGNAFSPSVFSAVKFLSIRLLSDESFQHCGSFLLLAARTLSLAASAHICADTMGIDWAFKRPNRQVSGAEARSWLVVVVAVVFE